MEKYILEGYGIFYFNIGDRYEGEYKNIKYKDMEYYIIIIQIDMKENLKTMKKKDME